MLTGDEFALEREVKTPRLLKLAFASKEETWRWIVRACERIDHRGMSTELPGVSATYFVRPDREDPRFDRVNVAHDPSPFVPLATDVDLAGYCDRVTALTGGKRFGAVVHGLEGVSVDLCERVRELLRDYQRRNGVRASPTVMAIFGNYARPAFGAPRESVEDYFQLVVQGRTRFRYWTGETIAADSSLERALLRSPTDYQTAEASSQVFEATAGDLLYWPGTTWHTSEAVAGTPSMSLIVRLSAPYFTLERATHRAIVSCLGRISRSSALEQEAPRPGEEMPSELIRASCEKLVRVLGTKLSPSVRHQWLCALTNAGIKYPRQQRGAVLMEGDRICATAERLRYVVVGDQMCVASRGLGFVSDGGMAPMIDELRSEQALLVSDLVRRYSAEYEADGVKHILDMLYATGAVRRVESSGSGSEEPTA
ncbi:hypothetical protein [Paraliomyxa miuraensis]|uniref:hypothetical protein n=1 Tax=Paraliomyxa miuraensis TaxID=376150 RepID=UPI00224E8FCC|nr:hypothetical protein [Paraliomyxa miuraensis]MCX4240533.1 hypothetical protein [Paraliomyxa miuraensis]